MSANHDERVAGLFAHLCGRVIGQDSSIRRLSEAIIPGELGLSPGGAPRSLVLICGPTGTGKTKAILEASAYLYGPEAAVARIDLGNFSTDDAVSRLVGSDPTDGGFLGQQIALLRKTGGRMLLLDEIEKANPKVADMLLGMEAARVTLANREVVDLSGYHIFATSNLAAQELMNCGTNEATLRKVVQDAATEFFRPEVFARFSAVVVYVKLSQKAQLSICRQMLDEELSYQSSVLTRKFGHPHKITVAGSVFRRLVNEGYHHDLGARPMRNVVQRRVRNAVAAALLEKTVFAEADRSILETSGAEGLRLVMPRNVRLSIPRLGRLGLPPPVI